MMRWLTIALGAMVLTAAAPALADDPAAGDKGELFVSADRLMGLFNFTSTKSSTGGMGGIDVESHNFTGISLLQNPYATPIAETGGNPTIAPYDFPHFSVDYTAIPHLTVGGSLVFDFNPGANDSSTAKAAGASMNTTVAAPKITEVGFAPRVGYFMSFNKYLAIWPRLGPSIYWLHVTSPSTTSGVGATTVDVTTLMLNVEPMVAITPVQHVAFTAGPVLDFSFWGQAKTNVPTSSSMSTETTSNLFLFHVGIELGMTAWF